MKTPPAQIAASTKMTVSCPSGHRLRGATGLMGRTVSCPKCGVNFAFAPTKVGVRGTGLAEPPRGERPAVSESRVMAILGEMTPPPPSTTKPTPTQPCGFCGCDVVESQSVCPACRSYLGVLPSFMDRLAEES